MTQEQFDWLTHFIHTRIGIKYGINKKVLLENRIQSRMRQLQIDTYSDYFKYVKRKEGHNEEQYLINAVTTNKTFFFREPHHFEFLYKEILPGFSNKRFNCWSAGCSSGEEPYSLAMTIQEFKDRNQLLDYQILATDIAENMLSLGKEATYPTVSHNIPKYYLEKYCTVNEDIGSVQINSLLRNKVSYQLFNLFDDDTKLSKFDLICCRNVLIYFKQDIQDKIVSKLIDHLNPEGYLFIGHSESLLGRKFQTKLIKPTIYQKV